VFFWHIQTGTCHGVFLAEKQQMALVVCHSVLINLQMLKSQTVRETFSLQLEGQILKGEKDRAGSIFDANTISNLMTESEWWHKLRMNKNF
jgi:hypothetical protein